MGDFNAAPKEDSIGWMRMQGIRDAFFDCHPSEEGWTWDNRNPFAAGASHHLPDRRIDYVFLQDATASWKCERCERIFMKPRQENLFASDHFGLLAEICKDKKGE